MFSELASEIGALYLKSHHYQSSWIMFWTWLIGLNKSDAIGDVGSRSFYLRKSSSSGRSSNGEQTPEAAPPVQRPVFFSPASLDRRIKKIVRRMRRFWKLLGCLHCEWVLPSPSTIIPIVRVTIFITLTSLIYTDP